MMITRLDLAARGDAEVKSAAGGLPQTLTSALSAPANPS
jgi:hypothetical protein